jgi:hypothetical protein
MLSSAMRSNTPYQPEHPTSLAMYCSDGRFTQAVEELLQSLGYERLDTLTIPGGPAHLAPATATASETQLIGDAASFLIVAHHVSHVVLLAHDNCGHYRQRFFGLDPATMRQKQEEDLKSARQTLINAHPRLEVRAFFAVPHQGHVRFDEVVG